MTHSDNFLRPFEALPSSTTPNQRYQPLPSTSNIPLHLHSSYGVSPLSPPASVTSSVESTSSLKRPRNKSKYPKVLWEANDHLLDKRLLEAFENNPLFKHIYFGVSSQGLSIPFSVNLSSGATSTSHLTASTSSAASISSSTSDAGTSTSGGTTDVGRRLHAVQFTKATCSREIARIVFPQELADVSLQDDGNEKLLYYTTSVRNRLSVMRRTYVHHSEALGKEGASLTLSELPADSPLREKWNKICRSWPIFERCHELWRNNSFFNPVGFGASTKAVSREEAPEATKTSANKRRQVLRKSNSGLSLASSSTDGNALYQRQSFVNSAHMDEDDDREVDIEGSDDIFASTHEFDLAAAPPSHLRLEDIAQLVGPSVVFPPTRSIANPSIASTSMSSITDASTDSSAVSSIRLLELREATRQEKIRSEVELTKLKLELENQREQRAHNERMMQLQIQLVMANSAANAASYEESQRFVNDQLSPPKADNPTAHLYLNGRSSPSNTTSYAETAFSPNSLLHGFTIRSPMSHSPAFSLDDSIANLNSALRQPPDEPDLS